MNDLTNTCIAWAQQFASEDIAVQIDRECFDQDYGSHVQIQIIPASLDKAKVVIILLEQSIGFTMECWSRLSRRVGCLAPSKSAETEVLDHVGAFLEPGVSSVYHAVSLLDAIAEGKMGIEVRVHRNRLVGSSASVRIGGRLERLHGPAMGLNLLGMMGLLAKEKLTYSRWTTEMKLLATTVAAL
jgi:hypothetical protein